MGQFYNELPDDEKLIEWIKEQKLFHVATAPLKGGHVNVSPKGLPSFKLVNKRACWYLDLAGSTNETISHMYEPGNGRITLMFEAFEGPPQILRLFGKGKVFERGTREFDEFFRPDKQAEDQYDFSTPELLPGARSVIWIDITQVGLSCGYTVPIMIFEKHRDTHTKFAARLEERDSATDDPFSLPPDKGMMSYMVAMNTWSIDGLPGMMQNAERATKENIRKTMVKYGLTPPGSRNLQFKWLQGERIGLVLVGIVLGIIVTILVQLSSSQKVWRLSKPVLCVGRYCLPIP